MPIRSVRMKPGAHVHDLAVVLGPEHRGHGADAVERAGHVGVEHLAPGVVGEPPERPVARDARVVDQEMDAAQPIARFTDEVLHPGPVAHVAAAGVDAHPHGRDGGFGEERLLGDVPAREVDVAEGEVTALPRKLERDRPAQSGGAAGHDGHLALEAFGDRLGLLLFEHVPRAFGRLSFPGGPGDVAEVAGGHGEPRYDSTSTSAR